MNAPDRNARHLGVLALTLALSAWLAGGPQRAVAGSLISKGQAAPPLRLTGVDGRPVELAGLHGRIVLLLFGELYNPNSVAAALDLATVVQSPPVQDRELAAFMVVTQDSPAAALSEEAGRAGVSLPILKDPGRLTFAAYEVMVLPSLVVVDPQGIVAMPCAGYPMDFPDLVSDAILLASGSLSADEFEHRRGSAPAASGSQAQARALRLAMLGDELARRGRDELATVKFQEALAIDPDCLAARIGLGNGGLARGDLAQAEAHFQQVLMNHPDSVEGAVGLIRVQLIRGGTEVGAAEERLRALLLKYPNDPKVVYLAGVAAEKAGDAAAALGRYRKAAELLLYGPETKRGVP